MSAICKDFIYRYMSDKNSRILKSRLRVCILLLISMSNQMRVTDVRFSVFNFHVIEIHTSIASDLTMHIRCQYQIILLNTLTLWFNTIILRFILRKISLNWVFRTWYLMRSCTNMVAEVYHLLLLVIWYRHLSHSAFDSIIKSRKRQWTIQLVMLQEIGWEKQHPYCIFHCSL